MTSLRLSPGEAVLFTAHPSSGVHAAFLLVCTLGMYALARLSMRATVTNRRVVWEWGFMPRERCELPLEQVQYVGVGRGWVTVTSACERLRLGPFADPVAGELAGAIRRRSRV